MRIGWVAKVAVGGVAVLALALAAYARFGTTDPSPGPRALKTVAPGVYTSPPPGIVAVNGECTGNLDANPGGVPLSGRHDLSLPGRLRLRGENLLSAQEPAEPDLRFRPHANERGLLPA